MAWIVIIHLDYTRLGTTLNKCYAIWNSYELKSIPFIFTSSRRIPLRNCFFSMLNAASLRPSVFVTRCNIPESVLAPLKACCDVECWTETTPIQKPELLKGVAGKHAIICCPVEPIDEDVLNAAGSQLKVVGTISVGLDHLNVKELKRRGIRIGYTPGVLTDATAELGVALLLATSRRLMEGYEEVKNGEWKPLDMFWHLGKSLFNSTVGIVGFGRIGQGIAKRVRPFGVKKILYSGPNRKSEGDDLGAEYVSFESLLNTSDFIVCCCTLNETTKELFNQKTFSLMKPSAIFINISRGLTVDHEALYNALTTGQIFAAGLDVTNPEPMPSTHPLISLPNCVIIPHIGSSDEGTRYKMAEMTVKNVISALNGKEMPAEI